MSGERRRPDFFIVGAPKSGTTAMYEYLRAHPQLFLPERKELRFFGSDLEVRDRPQPSLDAYLAFFADGGEARRIGTAYVWYLYSQRAAAEIRDFAPNADIIAMLRNPIEMVWSLHSEHLFNGNEDIRDFTAALDAEADRQNGLRIPAHAHLPQGLHYSQVPRYAEQLERYFTTFGRDRVHVILYDDFAADVRSSYRAVLSFLGVEPGSSPPAFEVINANKRTRSEWFRHFLARPPELPRRIIRTVVPASLRRAAYERGKRMNVAATRREPMPSATRERLRRVFQPEVERLSLLIGRDLSDWVRPPR
ncbi:MAG: sulfotransferase [Chloroflexota bacterium]